MSSSGGSGPGAAPRTRPATREPSGHPATGCSAPRDGAWIALGVLGEPRLWDITCRALALDDLSGISFSDRLARTAEVNDRIATAIAQLDQATVLALICSRHTVCRCPPC